MQSIRIPISPESMTPLYLTVSINLDYDTKTIQEEQNLHIVKDNGLTSAEKRVLINIGLPAKLIADRLNLSVNTVKQHIVSIRKKTNSKTSKELAMWAMKNNLI